MTTDAVRKRGIYRLITAWLVVPVVASVPFGEVLVVAYPLALIVTSVLGIPAFFLLRRLGWVQWWHAAIVGLGCGAPLLVLDLNSPLRADLFGPAHALGLGMIGAACGVLFWLIAVFRNSAIKRSSRNLPWSLLALLPAYAVAAWGYVRVDPHDLHVRVMALHDAPVADPSAPATADILLASGEVAVAVLTDKHRPPPTPDLCAAVTGRKTLVGSVRKYWVLSLSERPFVDFDGC